MFKFEKKPEGFKLYGAGWFWVILSRDGRVLEMAPGMREKPAHREFVKNARKHLLSSIV